MINLAEIVNPCLQLVIFSLLTMDYDGNFDYEVLKWIYVGSIETNYLCREYYIDKYVDIW